VAPAASLTEPRRPVTQATVLADHGFDATRKALDGPNACRTLAWSRNTQAHAKGR
jgi:hypothetical protein